MDNVCQIKTIILPKEPTKQVQIFDYHSTKKVSKQKVILNQNVFSFLLEGNKEVLFNSTALSIDNSKFLLMKSGHSLMTEILSKKGNYRSILLFFNKEMILNFIRKREFKESETSQYGYVYPFQSDEFTLRFVQSLIDISKFSVSIQEKLLEVKLEEIMLYLIEKNGTDFLSFLTYKDDNSSQKFIQIIETNQFNKLTIAELSFLCGMSISTFKREFEKHFAESPSKWFQNKRMEYAHHLINKEKKNSSEVYFKVGYENLSSFIKAYKTKYGSTPKQQCKI